VFTDPVAAHERRQVGQYVLVVGFLHEPAFVEELNGASITVFRTDGQPVEGLEKTLRVEVIVGPATRTFDLKPEPSKPGAYKAEFFPTRTGTYAFRFFGKIEGLDVNERFESGPGRFDEVISKAELQFPATVPSNGELAQRSAGAATPVPVASAGLQPVQDRADTAFVLAVLGLGTGLLGVVLGVAALVGRRSRATAATRHGGEPV
jgi:hypothetical protein